MRVNILISRLFISSIVLFILHAFSAQAPSRETDAPEGKTVHVNGMDMYFEMHGEGKPLLLLHGFSGSGASWAPFIEPLSKGHQLIVPDLRGHGRSTNPADSFTHRQAALDVFALLDHLHIDKIETMGISSGGMTLIHMATQQPNKVNAMILIGATHYFPEQARAIQRQVTEDVLTEKGHWFSYESMRKVHVHGDEQIRKLRRQFNAFKDSYDDMNFTPPYLSTITARTLIVHGDRDAHFPVEIPVQIYKSIPNASLWVIPNGGHVPIYRADIPFATTALSFLEDSEPEP